MDSLRKLRSKVLKKNPVGSDKKNRDKTIRHSRSLPLRASSDTDESSHVRPIYRGDRPLKPSDIRHPADLISPKAFSGRPVYRGNRPLKPSDIRHPMDSFTGTRELNKSHTYKTAKNSDILLQFPSPPSSHTPSSSISRPSTDSEYVPTRPYTRPPPLDDIYPELLPPSITLNPIDLVEERRRYNAIEAARGRKRSESLSREPLYHRRNDSSSSFSRPTVDAYPEAVQKYYHIRQDSVQSQRTGLTSHSNYSTQSLGANARLRDGPVIHRPVVHNASTGMYEPGHRQRMPSSASVNSPSDSVPKTYTTSGSGYRQRNASSASVNGPPNSAASLGHRQRMHSLAGVSGPPNSMARHPRYQTQVGRRAFKRDPTGESERRLASNSSRESADELGYVIIPTTPDPTFYHRVPSESDISAPRALSRSRAASRT